MLGSTASFIYIRRYRAIRSHPVPRDQLVLMEELPSEGQAILACAQIPDTLAESIGEFKMRRAAIILTIALAFVSVAHAADVTNTTDTTPVHHDNGAETTTVHHTTVRT